MGGRGPTRKDPDKRQRRNEPSTLVPVGDEFDEDLAVTDAPQPPPPPPAGLLKVTRDRWDEFWTSPVAALADRVSDRTALERLFSLYDDLERCGRTVRKAGHMVVGSKGQLVMNPLLRHMQTQASEIRQLEDRFGLSPRARLGLNMTLGQTAKTLADLNHGLGGGDGDDEDDDPRLDDAIPGEVVDDGTASQRSA
ncbi:P27 family phage terminase small subunit [Actinomadura sp. DC4]|uniref:phage terminase small subunit n=1 Tax=Actinomadura sp. DC4 TaxID=3055069 RepID=UPI0025B105C0|nr:P27 family phage terminase small subunit [Actinomadura sp. DC4]MDN3356069.1 P27 family phage terminase small subunit [Actinomadura sp. DC4]